MDRRGGETPEKAADRLKEIFKGFSSDKRTFVKLVHDTRKVAEEIQEKLTRNVADERFKENITTLLKEKEEVDQVMNQEPSIIVVGQTKSGKSSFINELLEKTVLAADQRPCTARLTQLEHVDCQEKPKVIIVSQGGKVLSEERLLKKYIPADLVNLPFEKRENKEAVYAKVIARIENDFLKSGVRIIDSPGRNENSLLDDLVMDHMKSILPLVIYVIDGRNQLTLRDKEDINSILGQTLPENMFFVVTKIEADEDDMSSSEEESDEDDDDDDDDYKKEIEEKETKNKSAVYRKLCDEGFLDGSVAMEDCPRFHGLSAWKIKTHRKKAETMPNRYTKAFDRFKSCLVDFTKKQLQYHIDCAAKSLADNHRMCIDVFIDEANRIYDERHAYKDTVERAERSEDKLHDEILGKIAGDGQKLEEVIRACFSEEIFDDIKKGAAEYKYKPYQPKKKRNSMISSTETLPSEGAAATMTFDGKMVYGIEETNVIEITVPANGFINNGELVQECRQQIERFVYNRLGNLLSRKVWAHFSEDDGLLSQMWSELSNLKLEDTDGKSATVESLKGMMIKNYKFDPKKEHFEEKLKMKIRNALRNLLRRFVGMFKGEMGRTGVGMPEWKVAIAGDSLEKVSATRIKDGVMRELVDHIKSGHTSFRKEIRMMKEVYQKQLELGKAARKEIRGYTPRIASLELRSLDLVDRHIYGIPQCLRTLGSGTQGSVHGTKLRGPNNEKLAMKVIIGRCIKGADPLDKIATEVHHLRQLSHPNLAKLHGCIILNDTSQDGAGTPSTEIGMLIEEMKGDLLALLPQYSRLNDRLKMALEAGYAVRYLHQRKMIHRDIKPANVLLGENGRVILTDFGCCKPIGLMNESLLGTPIHMAPEMLTTDTQDYDNKIDVYAFGIFLWYCAEGAGNHPIDPAVEDSVGVVFQNTRLGRRPKCQPHFPVALWGLMERCWDENVQKRPTMDEVCAELERMIRE